MYQNSALFFPSMSFTDVSWLKRNLVYLDHIYRIVPPGIDPADSDEVKALVDADLVRSVSPSALERERVSASFGEFLETCECRPSALLGDEEEIARLHQGKVADQLYNAFKELGFVASDVGWMEVPSRLAHGYMLYLAEAMAKSRGLGKITNNHDSLIIASIFDYEGEIESDVFSPDISDCYAAISILSSIPERVEHISVPELVELRGRMLYHRNRFATVVAEFFSTLRSVEDQRHRDQLVRDFHDSLAKCEAEKSAAYEGFGAAVPWAVTGIIATSLQVFSGGVSGGFFAPLALGGSTAMSFLASASQAVADKRRAVASYPRSFYTSLDRELVRSMRTVNPHRGNRFYEVIEEYICD